MTREDVRNLILGYPSLKNKNVGTFLGEIHRINPEILGYPRIPGYPLTTSLRMTNFVIRFSPLKKDDKKLFAKINLFMVYIEFFAFLFLSKTLKLPSEDME